MVLVIKSLLRSRILRVYYFSNSVDTAYYLKNEKNINNPVINFTSVFIQSE